MHLPSTMTLVYANTADTKPDTNTVRWVVRNWDGADEGIDGNVIDAVKKSNDHCITDG